MKISCSFRYSFPPLARYLFREWFLVCQPKRELACQLLVDIDQGLVPAPAYPPRPVHTFSWVCGCDPIVDRRGNQANRVCRFRLLADNNQGIGIAPLPWGTEMLDLVKSCFIQVQVFPQGRRVARLAANDLGRRVLYDPGAVGPRLRLGTNKVLRRLADSPYAGVPLARRAEQLHDLGREDRGIKQEPAFIKYRDAGL